MSDAHDNAEDDRAALARHATEDAAPSDAAPPLPDPDAALVAETAGKLLVAWIGPGTPPEAVRLYAAAAWADARAFVAARGPR